MAKGDIVAKLVLNSKDFDGKLAKSKKEVGGLQNFGSKAFGGLTSAVKSFAVAAGVAATASEAFKKVISSSQGLTDAWGRSLEATKTVFDNFVYSLANADFTNFEQGLSNMIERAKEAYDAFDQLANTQMSANFVMSIDQAKFKDALSRAKDKNLSQEARQAAINEAKEYMANISEAQAKLASDSYKALKAKYSAMTGLPAERITAHAIEESYRVDAKFISADERSKIEADVAAYKEKMKEADRAELGYYGFSKGLKWEKQKSGDRAKAEQLRREADAKYASSLVKSVALMRLEDEALQADMATYASATNASRMVSEMRTTLNETQQQLNAPTTTTPKVAATPAVAPALIGRTVDLEMQKTLPGMPSQTALDLPKTIISPIDDATTKGFIDALNFEAEIAQMTEAQKNAESLGNSFTTLGDAIGGAAGNMLSFAGSITDAVAAVIPFLSYLQAEAVAHDTNASAAMGEAAAKTLAAYSGIPFAGIALGAAAVASIIGVMKSLPMLADGGVVTGPTVAMIGEAGKEAVIPLDRLNDFIDAAPREVRVTGEIHAAGKDLVAVFDNYNKVRRVK